MARELLEPYCRKRIVVRGWVDRHDVWNDYQSYRNIPTTCIQRVELGDKIVAPHAWVFYTKKLKEAGAMSGDYIEFEAEVNSYKKRLNVPNALGLMQETDYKLQYPSCVKIIESADPLYEEPEGIPAPVVVPPVVQVDLFGLISDVKNLAAELGGVKLAAILPHIERVRELSERVGGPDKLKQLAEVIG